MTRFPALLTLLALAPLSAEAAFLRIDFSGTANSFNVGPFAADSPVVGSFLFDLSVPDTGASTPTFVGALQDLDFSVGPFSFGGDDGRLQVVPLGGQQVALLGGFGGVNGGTVSGTVPGVDADFVLDRISFDVRFAQELLMGDLTAIGAGDISFLSLTVAFTHPTADITDRTLIMRGNEFDFISVTAVAPVPVPAAAWLFASGIAAVAAVGRRKA